ncbi:hypothetical protein NHQ30_009149 [Ciborinia camelliae]|nr:hypothetical protein NHQ30_009149 [Ciborinia camelliae]
MSSLTNVMSLLNATMLNYPKDLPRSKLEVIQILGELEPKEKMFCSHVMRMETVKDDDLEEMCNAIVVLLIHATGLAEEIIAWASGHFTLQSGPSDRVLEALRTIYKAFSQFERLTDKRKPQFETRPQPFKDCCIAYLRSCFTCSIIFQRLLFPEDECDHLDYYEQSLEGDLESRFKWDTNQDYEDPHSKERYKKRKQTLSDCIHPADQIPPTCHLRAQPGKPVCPQYYRNPGPYGQRILPNRNHPSNRAYFLKKERYLSQRRANGMGGMNYYVPFQKTGQQISGSASLCGMKVFIEYLFPRLTDVKFTLHHSFMADIGLQ